MDAKFKNMTERQMFEHDELIFRKTLNLWKLQYERKEVIIPLDNGVGDHFAFKTILPELRKKYNKITLAVCFPAIFEDEKDVNLISIAEAKNILPNFDGLNIYQWMGERNWQGHIIEAFKELYL